MPKLWSDTIDAHRQEVRESILDGTWQLVTQRGALEVTMSQVALQVGIGRATLYKYFPDVQAILLAWHQRQVLAHLAELEQARAAAGDPAASVVAVLTTYAGICQHRSRHGSADLAALLHQGPEIARSTDQLHRLVVEVLTSGVQAGVVRDDIPVEELVTYALHALTAAGTLPSRRAMKHLVEVVTASLQPQER